MSVRKLDVTLPDDVIKAIESRVKTGRYRSTDEVMQAAVNALMREEGPSDEPLPGIRYHIHQSMEDPAPSISSGDMRAHVERPYARHLG